MRKYYLSLYRDLHQERKTPRVEEFSTKKYFLRLEKNNLSLTVLNSNFFEKQLRINALFKAYFKSTSSF
ncbi:MAG: hypothetical protein ACXACU_16415, partial [Candidatus Hodarchaeales archaeon]